MVVSALSCLGWLCRKPTREHGRTGETGFGMYDQVGRDPFEQAPMASFVLKTHAKATLNEQVGVTLCHTTHDIGPVKCTEGEHEVSGHLSQ